MEWLRNHIDELLASGVIQHSRSPYAAISVIVDKKDGSLRLAIDYRKINKITEDFLYSLLRIDDLLTGFNGAVIFTSLDLARGY